MRWTQEVSERVGRVLWAGWHVRVTGPVGSPFECVAFVGRVGPGSVRPMILVVRVGEGIRVAGYRADGQEPAVQLVGALHEAGALVERAHASIV